VQFVTNAVFTYTGLTTRYRSKSLYKSILLLLSSRNILFVKRRENLRSGSNFKLQARNLSFKTWEAVFTNVRFRSWSSKPLRLFYPYLNIWLFYPYFMMIVGLHDHFNQGWLSMEAFFQTIIFFFFPF